ncbi:hypothetical protein PGT21_006716 [Puccinia graminis f. sp. tritici]|uniref:Uncharacterized protein n=1 Tax=Puccinia graminis f. sp. tritici TaxID=56615 RepID=A0A5B0PX64_PUCGR|nr:hypothetical protein PGTUg99_027428 [Puccinia graminis f. sp. tritici]KAA1105417.1 hypothetical protein PGT21_006716 [Puccinia graminis f. sp. tritici]
MDTAAGVDHARYALRPDRKTNKSPIRRLGRAHDTDHDSSAGNFLSHPPTLVGASGSAGGRVPWKRARPGENSPPDPHTTGLGVGKEEPTGGLGIRDRCQKCKI